MPGKCLPAVVGAGIAVVASAANAHDEQGRAAGVAKMIAFARTDRKHGLGMGRQRQNEASLARTARCGCAEDPIRPVAAYLDRHQTLDENMLFMLGPKSHQKTASREKSGCGLWLRTKCHPNRRQSDRFDY